MTDEEFEVKFNEFIDNINHISEQIDNSKTMTNQEKYNAYTKLI